MTSMAYVTVDISDEDVRKLKKLLAWGQGKRKCRRTAKPIVEGCEALSNVIKQAEFSNVELPTSSQEERTSMFDNLR